MIISLILHIAIAFSGLVASTVAFIVPSPRKIATTFGLIAATIASGTVLVIETHSSILHSCVSGLVYVGLASSGALMARRKLAQETITKK